MVRKAGWGIGEGCSIARKALLLIVFFFFFLISFSYSLSDADRVETALSQPFKRPYETLRVTSDYWGQDDVNFSFALDKALSYQLSDANQLYLWRENWKRLGLETPVSLWSALYQGEEDSKASLPSFVLRSQLPIFKSLRFESDAVLRWDVGFEGDGRRYTSYLKPFKLGDRRIRVTHYFEGELGEGGNGAYGWIISYPIKGRLFLSSSYQIFDLQDGAANLSFKGSISTVYLLNSSTSITLNFEVVNSENNKGSYNPEVVVNFKF